jgi:UDP-N-acetylmuramate dehydrogenase
MRITERQPLAPLTTFGIGGPARWLVDAASEDEIAEASEWARGREVPLFVLGRGSNVLVADAGFEGLVLRIAVKGTGRDGGLFRVGAGEDWDAFVSQAVNSGCAGVECLAGIPGTVGGTPVQNVGAYGQEVASVIDRVRGYDLQLRTFTEFSGVECEFAYRRSRFNTTDRGRYIVTRVDYRLIPGGAPAVRYPDLVKALMEFERPSLAEVAAAVRQIRKGKGMLLVEGDPDCRSAGSFFKNPIVSKDQFRSIAERSGIAPPSFPAGPGTENESRMKIPAAWLIEQAGFAKGYAMGAAGISTKHTLAIVNRGGARAQEILALADRIVSGVEARFGIRLEMEPEMVGF